MEADEYNVFSDEEKESLVDVALYNPEVEEHQLLALNEERRLLFVKWLVETGRLDEFTTRDVSDNQPS